MGTFDLLKRPWKDRLARLVRETREELVLVAPYVSRRGAEFVASNVPDRVRDAGRLSILTDLSPLPICQGSTDPDAVNLLMGIAPSAELFHLPRLHAKVYVADSRRAIVTSANLTAGGLDVNYEFGVEIADPVLVGDLRDDLREYSRLGAALDRRRLDDFRQIAARLRDDFHDRFNAVDEEIRREFDRAFRETEESLIRFRLSGGAVHSVFAKTIEYLLKRDGRLSTQDLHARVQAIHPDLCDDAVDRVIDGQRFGKKWKHAVRTAQQMLKKRGAIELREGAWTLSPGLPERDRSESDDA